MRSLIEIIEFYHENKEDIEAFIKCQKKENFHSMREAMERANNPEESSMKLYMGSNESIIFWIVELVIIVAAVWLIIENGQYMSTVTVAFSVMLLLLPFGPIFSIILVLINRKLPEKKSE
tara:strand:- start:28 stop:387 length:360 start_codon:yes stop_codon:yes gene_type:complete